MKAFQKYLKQYQEISQKLASPEIAGNASKLKELSRQHSHLEEIKNTIEEIERIEKIIQHNEKLINNEKEDRDLIEIAKEENLNLNKKLEQLRQTFEVLTIPRDPHDSRDVILEIRAGAGGDEAGLFAGELFRMYCRYAERKGFKLSVMSTHKNEIGGIKELIAEIKGENAYGELKHDSGVHRVQRIPETEKSGRIHTSTATVAILPQAEETDIAIKPEDVKVDTFRSSGPGGQSVNTTDSAVRLTHIPTDIVVTCQDEKSQHKNKAKAFSILRSRLLQKKREEEQDKIDSLRSSQIGTGDRSEKIRTYNFPQDRLTDHRVKQNWHGLENIMDGDIDPILKTLKEYELNQRKEKAA